MAHGSFYRMVGDLGLRKLVTTLELEAFLPTQTGKQLVTGEFDDPCWVSDGGEENLG